MGYETRFEGAFAIEPALSPQQRDYLTLFARTRRMLRDAEITAGRPDPVRLAAGLPVGPHGAFFVGAGGELGQEGSPFAGASEPSPRALGVLDFNLPPAEQPHLWCCWEPTSDGRGLRCPEPGYHYEYAAWLRYFLDCFFLPWGRGLSGEVTYLGERKGDRGRLVVSAAGVERFEEGTPGQTGAAMASYERGKRYFDAEVWTEAKPVLEQCVERAPFWANPAWMLGSTLWRFGDPVGFELMKRAIELDPASTGVAKRRARLAERLRAAGREDEARDWEEPGC